MSRTFRRKNKETNEVYREFTPYYVGNFWTGWSYHRLEGDALKESLRKFHSESFRNYGYSAPKEHRKATTKVQRMHDKTELIKYTKGDYEPMVYDRKKMEYWT